MYRLPAVHYRVVSMRDWNVKLGPHVIGTHLDTSAYIKDLDGFFASIRAKNENEYIRHCFSLFEPTGFYLDDVILGPAKQPTEGKVFGNVIEECLEAFFSACCEDVKYTQI